MIHESKSMLFGKQCYYIGFFNCSITRYGALRDFMCIVQFEQAFGHTIEADDLKKKLSSDSELF